MTVIIEKISENQFLIDGLAVYKDHNDKWVGNPLLNPTQVAIFQKHLKAIEDHNLKEVKAAYQL